MSYSIVTDFFSRQSPSNISSFLRKQKTTIALRKLLDIEFKKIIFKPIAAPVLDTASKENKLKEEEKLAQEKKLKTEWLQENSFLFLAAFIDYLNINQQWNKYFLQEFLEKFFLHERGKVQKIAGHVYQCIVENFNTCLPESERGGFFQESEPQLEQEKMAQDVPLTFQDPDSDSVRTVLIGPHSNNPANYGASPFGEAHRLKLSENNKDFAAAKKKLQPIKYSFAENGPADPNFQWASDTLQSLMRRSVYQENPGLLAKRVALYLLGGFFIALGAAALIYLTLQTLGLIHLLWIPVIALAATGAGATVLGTTTTIIAAKPSVPSKFCGLFSRKKEERKIQEAPILDVRLGATVVI